MHIDCSVPQSISYLPVTWTQEVKHGVETEIRFSPNEDKRQWLQWTEEDIFYWLKMQEFSFVSKKKKSIS